jgi:4-deoxy-L-threo-5-hexosulose-uronate ketol-isomerase
MTTNIVERFASHPEDVKHYDTERIRKEFLIENLMEEDTIHWVYSHYDRFMVGGAVPVSKNLALETVDVLKAAYFLERRELGIINVGGKGSVVIDGKQYDLDYKEALYIGSGNKDICNQSY